MFRSLSLFALVLVLCPYALVASQTGNRYVTAYVDDETGVTSTGTSTYSLTAYNFLSVWIDGKIYTNNEIVSRKFGNSLGTGSTTKIGDTLRTLWKVQDHITVVQSVYPTQFISSGQIVIDVSIVNDGLVPVAAQAQYKYDLRVNEHGLIGFDYFYGPGWQQAPLPGHPTPDVLFCCQRPLPDKLGPGNIMVNRLRDERLGLVPPSNFTFGINPVLDTIIWGAPLELPTAGDGRSVGMLSQWQLLSVDGYSTRCLMRTGIGTAVVGFCANDDVECLTITDDAFVTDTLGAFLNRGMKVRGFLWNASGLINKAMGAILGAPSPLRITDPIGVYQDGHAHSELTNPLLVDPGKMGYVEWKIESESAKGDSVDVIQNITIDVMSGKNKVGFYPACSTPITLEGRLHNVVDHWEPVVISDSMSGAYGGTLCNARVHRVSVLDTGILISGIRSIAMGSATNMTLSVDAGITGNHRAGYTVRVIDTLQDGAIEVKALDNSGNISIENYTYCTIRDTAAPSVVGGVNGTWIDAQVSETAPWDRGIDSIVITDWNNITFGNLPLHSYVRGRTAYLLRARPVDPQKPASFCIQVADLAGNISPKQCFSMAVAGIEPQEVGPNALTVSPNPSHGVITVNIRSGTATQVTIYDMLGVAVYTVTLSTPSEEIDLHHLPAGSYIVRAEVNGRVLSKRLSISR